MVRRNVALRDASSTTLFVAAMPVHRVPSRALRDSSSGPAQPGIRSGADADRVR